MNRRFQNTFKKSIAFLLSLIMFISVTLNEGIVRKTYAEDNVITRAEWLNKLAETFDISIDDSNCPDNYFSDIDNETTYYDDIMKAVSYGIVDIEAGKEFKPAEPATREFAAQTLNACLGYQLEEDSSYTFTDSSDCKYPDDDQIAVNKGWFALDNDKFMPDNQITASESEKMINAATAEINKLEVSADYDSVWNVADGVKTIPEYVETIADDNVITITNSPVTINNDDIFVVYQGEIAVPYKAVSVSETGNQTVITTADVDEYDSAFSEVDAEGIIESDELTFTPLEGTELEIEFEDEPVVQTYSRNLAKASGTKKFKEVNFDTDFKISGNVKSTISGTFSNIKVKYNISTGSKETFVQVEGDLTLTGAIEAACEQSINIMQIGIPGIGGVTLTADIDAAAKVKSTITTHILAGASYSFSDGFRTIRSFKENGGSNTSVEGTASLGATLKCGITELKVISGYVYGKAGITAKIEDTTWTTGEPKNCKTFLAYMYASYGAEVKCKLINYKYSKKIEIYTLDNSPFRVYHHYEDGKPVAECTRGKTVEDKTSEYFTKYHSPHWNTGWAGCDSSYGLDDAGQPYAIYEYDVKKDNYDNEYAVITKYKGNMRNLTIPETLDGYEVREIGRDAFKGNKSITVMEIPDCIKEIGVGAFLGCSNLSDVKLSKGLTKMGTCAFGDCDALTGICIPKSLVETTDEYYPVYNDHFRYGVFIASDNLKDITFEEGTKVVAKGLFAHNTSIENVVIPDTVTEIGENAFDSCTNLKNIQLSSSLTRIDKEAFMYVQGLTEVDIPDTVVEIGTGAFWGCSNLSDVKLSNGLVKMGGFAFGDCDALTSIYIPKSLVETTSEYHYDYNNNNYYYKYQYGVFIASDNLKDITFEEGTKVVAKGLFAHNSSIENIAIPDTVTEIGDNAFEGCTNLKNVQFSSSLTRISKDAFSYVKGITEVDIPDTVVEIGAGAFLGCSNLSDVKLSKGLTKMGGYAFGDCDSLTSIFIPKNLVETTSEFYRDYCSNYQYGVFVYSDNLKDITFEEGITTVAKGLFAHNTSIENIVIPDTVTEIRNNAFEGCTNLKNVQFSPSLTRIGKDAFSYVKGITEVDIPDTVVEIGAGAFLGCSNLSDVKLSKGLTKMGGYAFGDCDSLTGIFIPKNLMETTSEFYRDYYSDYQYGVFVYSDNLKDITFEEGITTVAEGLFANNKSIENIVIPDTVKEIGYKSFEGCSNLKSIKLSSQLQKMGEDVFYNALMLEIIEIPDTVTDMGDRCFNNCISLSYIKLPNKKESINKYMFYGCKSLKEITLPDTVKEIKESAFEASGLTNIKMSPNVIKIEKNAFADTPLENIEFSGKEASIGDNAFKNCDSMKSITIPNSVTYIGSGIFQDCDALNDVKLGTGITSIPANAFEHCDALNQIMIPFKVEKICDNAFANSIRFTEITIPRGTTEISSNAFSYPTKTTVYGIKGTYAETYANEKGMQFVNKEVKASQVTLSETDLLLNVNDKKSLIIDITPVNFTDEVDWKSTDANVVTVDKVGNIKAVGVGTATIKVTVGSLSATCKVTVLQPVNNINLGAYNIELENGETYHLSTSVYPSNANNKQIEWSSSNSDVAIVDQNGNITAVGKGKAIITVTARDGSGAKAECTVTVTNNSYIVTDVSKMESGHPYDNNCKDIWTYSIKDAKALAITFDEKTEMEDGFDNLIILDANNTQIGVYTGKQLAGKTITVTGDTVKIKLDTDNGGSAYGFKVSSITATGKQDSVKGDANGDGNMDIKDSAIIKRYLAGWDVEIDMTAADMDGDGKVTIKDSALIKRQLAGWE